VSTLTLAQKIKRSKIIWSNRPLWQKAQMCAALYTKEPEHQRRLAETMLRRAKFVLRRHGLEENAFRDSAEG